MFGILMAISVVLAVVMIIVVLLQSSKGGGLSGTFGGGAQMGAMFGARRTADFLSRATWWIGGFIVVLALVINLFFLPGSTASDDRESVIQQGPRQNVPTQPTLPQQ